MKRTALISGASGAIGFECAKSLAKEGFNIVAHYHKNQMAANHLVDLIKQNGGDAVALSADLAHEQEVNELFLQATKSFGGVDVLVNNAGLSQFELLTDMSTSSYYRLIDVNLTAAFFLSRLIIPHMVSNKWGRIINISSVWAQSGASMESIYSAAKAGLVGLTKALAKELAPSNILVNAIDCGVIDTPMNSGIDQGTLKSLIEQIPLQRLGKPCDIAEMVVFLATKADYITGQAITVDGGFNI